MKNQFFYLLMNVGIVIEIISKWVFKIEDNHFLFIVIALLLLNIADNLNDIKNDAK